MKYLILHFPKKLKTNSQQLKNKLKINIKQSKNKLRWGIPPCLCTLSFWSGNLCFMPERSRETTPAQFGLAMLVPIISCFFCSVQLGTGEIAPPGAMTLTPGTIDNTQIISKC